MNKSEFDPNNTSEELQLELSNSPANVRDASINLSTGMEKGSGSGFMLRMVHIKDIDKEESHHQEMNNNPSHRLNADDVPCEQLLGSSEAQTVSSEVFPESAEVEDSVSSAHESGHAHEINDAHHIDSGLTKTTIFERIFYYYQLLVYIFLLCCISYGFWNFIFDIAQDLFI
ncbi:hypothetical protein WICANDRAFT_79361 [Wickerhamomyces anomalus NRRL Y-366-8]|uniref:Uncharacterized protein n=1 Tax=Wickerhamomyces anomalus (strain ATCC 58044 / CBS 1984 / NCYC 433 / NRRL Y-366-8) TaxID=683960 RepID=A0A1E3P0D2_WICAA|nr:uncharacterized protein WICANDRAFT_79361 [Wickerhamomyces anomalus NRRL Y-366-8]ODQ58815.1 hypothetical protein WICANDRAFT_79361 [Wickerhamomyces anomalus NRRL Y-366-8]